MTDAPQDPKQVTRDARKRALTFESSKRTTEFLDDIRFNNNHYVGGRQFLREVYRQADQNKSPTEDGSYLVKFFREPKALYKTRALLSEYQNVAREVIDRLVGFVYQLPPTRPSWPGGSSSLVAPLWDKYAQNPTERDGVTANDFWREAMVNRLVHGPAFVWIDIPFDRFEIVATNTAEGPVAAFKNPTIEEATKRDIRPRLRLIPALDMLHWGPDLENPRWCKFRIKDLAGSPFWEIEDQKPDDVPWTYVVCTKYSTAFYYDDGTEGPRWDHDFGELPVVPVSKTWWDRSPLEDIFITANRLYNLDAQVVSLILDLVFAILTYNGDRETDLPTAAGASDDPAQQGRPRPIQAEKGPDRILTYPQGANAPGLLGPDPDSVPALLSVRESKVQALFRRVMMQATVTSPSVQQTAEGKRRDWQDSRQGFITMAEMMEAAETRANNFAARFLLWMDGKPKPEPAAFPIGVSYSKLFDIGEIESLGEEISRSLSLPLGREAILEMVTGYCKTRFAAVGNERLEKIVKEATAAVDALLATISPPPV